MAKVKFCLYILWIAALMAALTGIGSLLSIPSTIANLAGVLAIVLAIIFFSWTFKLINSIKSKNQKS